MPAGCWASDRKHCKRQSDAISNAIENEEASCDIAKLTSNNYEKVDFDVDVAKQVRLSKDQQGKLKALWVKHEKLLHGVVGNTQKERQN